MSESDGWKILFGIMWLNSPPDERVSARSFTAGLAARMRLVAWLVHLLQEAHTKERLPGIFAVLSEAFGFERCLTGILFERGGELCCRISLCPLLSVDQELRLPCLVSCGLTLLLPAYRQPVDVCPL